jgi:hypothetical protein
MKQLLTDLLNHAREMTGTFWYTRIIILLIMVSLIGYMTASLIAPVYTLRQLNHGKMIEADPESGSEPVLPEFQETSSLVRQKAYLESRIVMAGSDSIGMVVDLRDSMLSLEINGITIHRAKITDYRVEKFFFALKNKTYTDLFSKPLIVDKEQGTIVKEPVFVQKAPRDTSEAANNLFLPDTIQIRAAFVTFHLGRGVRLSLQEDTRGSFMKKCRKFSHLTGVRTHQTCKNIYAIVRFRVPEYEPAITISLSGKDITSIYRALPGKAMVAILI